MAARCQSTIRLAVIRGPNSHFGSERARLTFRIYASSVPRGLLLLAGGVAITLCICCCCPASPPRTRRVSRCFPFCAGCGDFATDDCEGEFCPGPSSRSGVGSLGPRTARTCTCTTFGAGALYRNNSRWSCNATASGSPHCVSGSSRVIPETILWLLRIAAIGFPSHDLTGVANTPGRRWPARIW